MTHSKPLSYEARADAVGVGARAVAFAPAALTLLRVGAGLLFIEHGLQKLFGMLGGVDGAGATAPLASQLGVSGLIEFLGGLLLIIGFLTRPVALICAAEMIAAFLTFHLPKGGAPIQNGGELALLYFLVFVYFAARGAGPYSVDAAIGRGRRT